MMVQRTEKESMTGRRRWRVVAGSAALLFIGVSGDLALGLRGVAIGEAQALCSAYPGLPEGTSATRGMIFVSGGSFRMGSDKHFPEEKPQRVASVGGFWIDRHEVTNAQFAAFVTATGYITVAERPVDPALYPGAPPHLLLPGGMVFHAPAALGSAEDFRQWWRYTPGANWRHPQGPGSSIDDRMNHPVVQVTHEDAAAYARWAGRDLPTEAEWELAARGGLDGAEYVWGDEKTPSGVWQANVWQGRFPVSNQLLDGFEGTAPVGCFEANRYGLVDMAGNVWELTADDYRDQRGLQRGMKVVKGGSHLCADNYCFRYRPSARQPAAVDSGSSHIGFRTVLRKGEDHS
jgi:formylglycine-generating enzyme required for sulfatase activity